MTGGRTMSSGESRSQELRELAKALDAVTRHVDGTGGTTARPARAGHPRRHPSAQSVSLTVLERGRFETRAATDELARDADALQYELGTGPCVDAVLEDTANISGDIAADPRWGEWGPRVAAELGVRSVLAYRLLLEGDHQSIASLNVYSARADAFDERALHLGVVLATHGSLLMTAVMARDVAANLADTLRANREIGVAMGVLMYRHRVTRDQAFDLLRLASQQNALTCRRSRPRSPTPVTSHARVAAGKRRGGRGPGRPSGS